MEEIARIPPAESQDYPINAIFDIRRQGARYEASIISEGQGRKVPIEMSLHDLSRLNSQLQEAMEKFVRPNARYLRSEHRDLLRDLARIGHYAFRQIFGHPIALSVVQSLLSLSTQLSIDIASDDFYLPWELIYPASLRDGPLSYDGFWGMQHNISRVVAQTRRSGNLAPGGIIRERYPGGFRSPVRIVVRPKVGLFTYCELPNVLEKEIPFFKRLAANGKITLFELRPLYKEKWDEEFEEFRRFWNYSFDLAHFACHASYEEPPSKSRILLSHRFPVTLEDMEVYELNIRGSPLVIMNACETGNLNPLYTSYFAAAFQKCGALGIVATECTVPDELAADFAEQLYVHLLEGKELGESLLETRRYFLRERHNPLGLLYSMYAPSGFKLEVKAEA